MTMHIVKFSAKDVLGLTAVEITPDGNIVILGGPNGAGKSSCLNAIALALGGSKALGRGKRKKIKRPIRDGAESGEVLLDLGDLVVERVFTASGDRLTVKAKDGAVYKKPQTMLDALFNAVTFDPLAFVDADDDKQAEQLRVLMGVDLSELDAEHDRLFRERAAVNLTGRNLKGAVEQRQPKHADAPAEEISVAELMSELAKLATVKAENDTKRANASTAEYDHQATESGVIDARERVKVFEEKLAEARAELETALAAEKTAKTYARTLRTEATALTDPDIEAVRAQITGAEAVNSKVRENRERDKQERELDQLREQSKELSAKLEANDNERQKRIAAANFPVDGLGFDESGVTLDGVPFSQANRAEQLRVSVAVGIAANPELLVFMIRDGSLLDKSSLALMCKLATEHGCDLWIEDSRTTDPTAVYIEDGHVRGAAPDPEASTA